MVLFLQPHNRGPGQMVALAAILSCVAISRGQMPTTGDVQAADQAKVKRLIGQLGSEDFDERDRAMKELVAVAAPALEPLRVAVKGPDVEVARRAEECIAQIERNLKVAALIRELQDTDPEKRIRAAEEVRGFNPPAKEAVPHLVKGLDDPHEKARLWSLCALYSFGPEAKPALPRLLEILNDPKSSGVFRYRAVLVLREMGPAAEDATPVLLRIVQTENDALIRPNAVLALGGAGKNHAQVIPILLQLLKDKEKRIVGFAGSALGKIGNDSATCVPALVAALKEHNKDGEDYTPRYYIVQALGRFGPDAQPAVPLLIGILQERDARDYHTKFVTVDTLRQIGPGARAAIPTLRQDFKHRAANERAAQAIAEIQRTDP